MAKKTRKLSRSSFIDVVKRTPLVSIDIIVENRRNQVLLGLRKNEPAKGFWFVPGGRILKNERIAKDPKVHTYTKAYFR
jgi:colanic acid biosynthesis protein WcaH